MSEDKNKVPGLPISGLVIVLAALGLTVFNPTPFTGHRPPVPEIRESLEKPDARLWQDPFRAVIDYLKLTEASSSRVSNTSPDTSEVTRDNSPIVLYNEVKSNDNIRNRRSKVSFLENQIEDKIEETKSAGKEVTKITALGVMVFGGTFAEDTERRLRYRYAALSGLHRLGYIPEDSEHIN
jgi:hypothetical protein